MAENFCSNCGKPLLQDDKFCSGCGKTTVRTAPSASTAPAKPYYDPNIGQPQPKYVQQVRPDIKSKTLEEKINDLERADIVRIVAGVLIIAFGVWMLSMSLPDTEASIILRLVPILFVAAGFAPIIIALKD